MTQIKILEPQMRTLLVTSKLNVSGNCTLLLRTKKLTEKQMIKFIRNVKFQLKSLVERHLYKGNCSVKEAKFLLSNMDVFKIPHIYIIWKSLKIPQWDTPALIFVGHFFEGILRTLQV